MTTPVEENNNADQIDNEEEGGEWITEENLHKHLANGLMLPIVPIEAEEGKEEIDAPSTNLEAVQEAAEEGNTDFPAFDEGQLPSMAELDQKKAKIDAEETKEDEDEGEDEEKEFASQEELQAALSEDKSSLIQETELSIKQEALRLSDPCKYIKCLFFLLVQSRGAHFTPIFQEKFAAIW